MFGWTTFIISDQLNSAILQIFEQHVNKQGSLSVLTMTGKMGSHFQDRYKKSCFFIKVLYKR